MHLVSRVNKSSIMCVRQHLILPITKCLILGAALMCSIIGIVGYFENKDIRKLLAIFMLSLLVVVAYFGIEVVLAWSRYKQLQVLYEKDVLNFHVYFDDDGIRVIGLDNKEVCRANYLNCRYCETDKYAVILIAWHVFIFDKTQAEQIGLKSYLKKQVTLAKSGQTETV